MAEPDFKALAEQTEAKYFRAIKAVKMAYRKHHLGDESIGWNELSDVLSEVLQEHMQDRAFERWAKQCSKGEAGEEE